jgi:hypothetical protein
MEDAGRWRRSYSVDAGRWLGAACIADGKFLYYTKDLGASEPGGTSVWRVPLGGGQAAKVLEGLSTYINLAIVDKGIYFIPVPDAASGYSIQFLDLPRSRSGGSPVLKDPLASGILPACLSLRMADASCIRKPIDKALS